MLDRNELISAQITFISDGIKPRKRFNSEYKIINTTVATLSLIVLCCSPLTVNRGSKKQCDSWSNRVLYSAIFSTDDICQYEGAPTGPKTAL